jgi:hypothetical protein|tara:strand:- start:4186 stop:4659 length:474 start_codon:yes stop_codon:yes gene_type:complete
MRLPGQLPGHRVISVVPGLGSFYISSAAQTTISGAGTAVKMAGTTTQISDRQFSHADNKLTYTGQRTSRFIITAVVSLDVASADDIISVQLFKNGSLITGAEQRSDNTAAKPTNIVVMIDTTLATSDYVEIYIENEDTTANIDVTQGYVMIQGIMGE